MRLDIAKAVLAVGDIVKYTNPYGQTPVYDEFNAHIGFVVSYNEQKGYCSVQWFTPVEYPARKGIFTERSSFECIRFQKVLND
jgi:hypothetical protein